MKNLIITGFMGTGKTAVGVEAARRLGMPFVDMDEVIERRAGMPISQIFARHGEETFRQQEADLAAELAQREGIVIATGGGTLLRPENREVLGRRGVMICLCCEPEEILRRLEKDDTRPLLSAPEREAKLAKIVERLAARQAAYQTLPWQVDTTGVPTEEVVEQVLAIYRSQSGES